LAYAGNPPGPCPDNGVHDFSVHTLTDDFDYALANFGQDRTFLIEGDWEPGEVFADTSRKVSIAIGPIDSAASQVTVTLSVTG
jgi:hypothetical protein